MRKNRRIAREDTGFTLVEVLVVTVMIGVLSGIAIPLLHSQSGKAQGATAASDLRSVSTAMETYFSDFQTYGSATEIAAQGMTPNLSQGTTVVIVQRTASGYCLAALRNTATPGSQSALQAAALRWLDSAGGGLQPKGATGCPTTTGYQTNWTTDRIVGPTG
jgi:prepilin-type N-terminal cleavage/methylation domain-containing protein